MCVCVCVCVCVCACVRVYVLIIVSRDKILRFKIIIKRKGRGLLFSLFISPRLPFLFSCEGGGRGGGERREVEKRERGGGRDRERTERERAYVVYTFLAVILL